MDGRMAGCSKKNREREKFSLQHSKVEVHLPCVAWLHFIIDTRVVLSGPYANQINTFQQPSC